MKASTSFSASSMAVHLPPVLSLVAVVVFGTQFGVEGIVLGTPLMVVAIE